MTAIFADVPDEVKRRLDDLRAARKYRGSVQAVVVEAIDLLHAQVFDDETRRSFATEGILYNYRTQEKTNG